MAHMILGQFGVPMVYLSEEEIGIEKSLLEQLVERLERADDATLIAVGQHLDYEPETIIPSTNDPNFGRLATFVSLFHISRRIG